MIKSSSTAGPDRLSAKIMRGGKSHIVKMLAIICETSMYANFFPKGDIGHEKASLELGDTIEYSDKLFEPI